MEGQGRSEAVVLQATVEYLKDQVKKKEQLRKIARARGMSDKDFERAYQGVRKASEEASEGEEERPRSSGRGGGGGGNNGDRR
jgi:hypothetical protein